MTLRISKKSHSADSPLIFDVKIVISLLYFKTSRVIAKRYMVNIVDYQVVEVSQKSILDAFFRTIN